ncbi:MAG: HalX domain-containing protein [Haloarculaceae archaeon]
MAGSVLVVDDESEVAELYAQHLRPDHDVRVAHGGEEALNAVDDAVDVVMLDRRLGDRSGDEVLEELRARGHDCRVVMVTGVTPEVDVVELPFDDYVVKPVGPEEVHAIVDRLLARATYHARAREYFRLVAKRAALCAHHSAAELADSEEFDRLETCIEEASDGLDGTLAEFENHDFRELFSSFSKHVCHSRN